MRVSVDSDDPGFTGKHGYKVLLDGAVVGECVTADEELGEVVVYKTDQHGWLVMNAERDAVERKTLKGRVEIFPPQ